MHRAGLGGVLASLPFGLGVRRGYQPRCKSDRASVYFFKIAIRNTIAGAHL